MYEIDSNYRIILNTAKIFQDQVDTFSHSVTSHFDSADIPSELKSQIYPFRDKFGSAITFLTESLMQAGERLSDLDRLLGEYKSVTLGSDGSGGGVAFGQHHSFTEFLLEFKKSWNAIVTDEHEALEKAIHYYKGAFAEGRDIAPGNQQIQASYLIAELSRRIGDHDEARQYFNSTIRHGQEFIHNSKHDATQTALARKILELAIEQGKVNMAALKTVQEVGAR
jgi:tetratricopeptide (TPR) repeat protein